MRWKIFTLFATVIVMLVTVPPTKVKAQALVEFSLALSVMIFSIGPNETAEAFFEPANPPKDPISSEDPLVAFNFIIEVSGVQGGDCRQTFEKAILESNVFGLPMLSVSKGFDQAPFVTVSDGTTVETHYLRSCFDDGRVAVVVAVPIPANVADQLADDTYTVPVGVRFPAAAWLSILDTAGRTMATSQVRRQFSNMDFRL